MNTEITIVGDAFHVNSKPTYEERYYQGSKVEGLLLISRMINGIFDDENPHTRRLWRYPDTGTWDPMRNTKELVEHIPEYASHGLNAITVGLQGGSPVAYSPPRMDIMNLLRESGVMASEEEVYAGCLDSDRAHPWDNTAFRSDGILKPEFLERLRMVIEEADDVGMAVILVLFYFGQDERLEDEEAVKNAVENACGWVLDQGYANVFIEINNECNVQRYEHEILQPHRVHELIEHAKHVTIDGRRLFVGTSYASGVDRWDRPDDKVVEVSDVVLLHGNGLDADGIVEWVERTRRLPSYRPMPILFDEDDHYEFEKPVNNFKAAISVYSGWGYFDNGGETVPCTHKNPALGNYRDGYQNVPVNWGISSQRKKAFFSLVRDISGVGE